MRKRRISYLFFVALTLIAYVSVFLPPSWWFVFGFFALLIPVFLLLQLFYFLHCLHYGKFTKSLLPLFLVLLGYPFIRASFATSIFGKSQSINETFSVLSYNVQVFNSFGRKNNIKSQKLISWVENDASDIKCLQEFYHIPQHKTFNTLQTIGKNHQYHTYFQCALTDKKGGQFGLAIFSRYPIINKGEIDLRDKSHNDAIFADVVMGNDTLRIYNIHLQSMKINQQRMTNTDKWKENAIDLAQRLSKGFAARAKQIDYVMTHIEKSPYPVIVCGDLNDVPYSYTYFSLRKKLLNAFEESGRGFGFTLNNLILYVRIDNQFHSESIKSTDYKTLDKVKYSDHFPIKVRYKMGE